ncbi:MAG: thiamine pyrophosphate-dependent dehydrogenase E1 component subunit alpha [Desulfobacteraceae bacterium]|nr:thiamine pyrophosphate-dependent dehydrogenase E1 component subunit alpha [Desulfobacteraceae bacterium]
MALTKEQLITLYKNLVRSRAFDQAFSRRLGEGKLLGFYHPAYGGEAPGVGACSFLRKDDYVWPHLRGHGLPHMISKGIDPKYFMAEHCGKATGSCCGMSTFHCVEPDFGLMGYAGTIGSNFPASIGYGLAAKKNGRGQVVMNCFGDGTSNRGTFHESALMVNNWKLPVIYLCENNGIGMYVSAKNAHPVEDIASLAQGYGMPGVVVDGQDVMAVAEAVQMAVERAREGKGPSMIEAKCERFGPHSMGVQDWWGGDVRAEEKVAKLRETRDPVKICQDKLLEHGIIQQEDIDKIKEDADADVVAAETFVDNSPKAEDPSVFDHMLYAQ